MDQLVLALVLGGLAGCVSRGKPPASPPWLRAAPDRCLIPRDLTESMETMARRCGELFVAQNGYTDLPATWELVFAARARTLGRNAVAVQCSVRQCLVFFPLRRAMPVCRLRAVGMSQVFTRLRLVPGTIPDVRCAQQPL